MAINRRKTRRFFLFLPALSRTGKMRGEKRISFFYLMSLFCLSCSAESRPRFPYCEAKRRAESRRKPKLSGRAEQCNCLCCFSFFLPAESRPDVLQREAKRRAESRRKPKLSGRAEQGSPFFFFVFRVGRQAHKGGCGRPEGAVARRLRLPGWGFLSLSLRGGLRGYPPYSFFLQAERCMEFLRFGMPFSEGARGKGGMPPSHRILFPPYCLPWTARKDTD